MWSTFMSNKEPYVKSKQTSGDYIQQDLQDANEKSSSNPKEKIKCHDEKPIFHCSDTIDSKLDEIYDTRIAALEKQLTQLQNDLRDTRLRAQAEIENIRRRTSIDIEKAHKFALEDFTNELLPVIDSLESALEAANKENTALSNMITGIDLTLKSLLKVISKFGVKIINDINIPFNPDVHQAMSVIESNEDNVANNYIVQVMQRGYILNGRLLRPAMVIVAKKKINS